LTIKLTTTQESTGYIKCLVYGKTDAGKTWLCRTVPKPVIISAEKGLLTLRDVKIPVIEVETLEDVEEAYELLKGPKGRKFKTICLDSISDIAENVLAEEKINCGNDPRRAYMFYADKLLPLIKKFRDISSKHVYFTAKQAYIEDDYTGITTFIPDMPGKTLANALPYLFDFVFALRIEQNEEGEKTRYLQTESDIQYISKNRGGMLSPTEPADLGYIFKKALSSINLKKETKKKDTVKKSKEAEKTIEKGLKIVEEIEKATLKLEREEKEMLKHEEEMSNFDGGFEEAFLEEK
jgi:hypothetical protein